MKTRYVLEAERKDKRGRYFVYFQSRSLTGLITNTQLIDTAKEFTFERDAIYEIQNGGDPMKEQRYKVTPVIYTHQ